MSWFSETPPRYVDPADLRLGVATARAAAADLGLDRVPPVRWFWGGAGTDTHRGKSAGFETDEFRPGALRGYREGFPEALWVRDGLDRRELVLTVAHEARHAEHEARAKHVSMTDRQREHDAEAYAERFADEFLRTAAAIKSAGIVVPETPVDDDGRFNAAIAVPGMHPWTDIGNDMYPRRPLLADGIAGMKGAVVGFIDAAEAREERLWIKAELDKSRKYWQYIGRLLEQGLISHNVETLRQRVEQRTGRLPVVLSVMRPLEAAA